MLASASLRATTQRVALLRTLLRASRPLSVEELTRSLRGALDTATAYRTLDAFIEAGIAHQVELSAGKALYEIAGEHHHHVVCTSCNRIEDVQICLPESLTDTVRKASGFSSVREHTLEFFGTCKKCVRTV